ncbi:MAG TPA: GNAT family N-acetyltransferase [Pseudonocardiaceae bacterium]
MTHPAEVLTGERTTLRRFGAADAEALHRVVNESLEHLRPWMPWAAGDYGPDAAREFLSRCDEQWAAGTGHAYAVTIDGGALVGACGLHEHTEPDLWEIGYWLHPAHTGHGLATEASTLLVAAAFALPGITRVRIWHDAANTRSGAVPRRLGFTELERGPSTRAGLCPGESGIGVSWELRATPPP